jgi:hypothetical protein
MFAKCEAIPEEFSRKEVIAILQAYYDSIRNVPERTSLHAQGR